MPWPIHGPKPISGTGAYSQSTHTGMSGYDIYGTMKSTDKKKKKR